MADYVDYAKLMYAEYKTRAKKSGKTFSLTREEFYQLSQYNCYYCGTPPQLMSQRKLRNNKLKPHPFNGIDRIDNNKGYTIGNCLTCCSLCNRMKSNTTVADFIQKINMIYKKLFGGANPTPTISHTADCDRDPAAD